MAKSLWKRLARLPLEVESYTLERLEQPVTRGFTRVTTVVRLSGRGEEGVGEDVSWYAEMHDREQAAGPVLPLQGSWTLDSFSEALEIPEPHRRWAYESAAPDGFLGNPWNPRLLPHYALVVWVVVTHVGLGLRGVLRAHGVADRAANLVARGASVAGAAMSLAISCALLGVHLATF